MIKMYAAILILDDPHKCQFYGFTDKFNSARRKEVTLLFDPLKCHNSHSFVMCKIFFLCRIDVLSVYYARKCSIFISRIFSKVTSYPIGESETHMRQRITNQLPVLTNQNTKSRINIWSALRLPTNIVIFFFVGGSGLYY